MTKNPQKTPSTYQKIWQLSWPLIIANISVPLLGLIDTAILGHLPSAEYLAAVSVGASFVSIILLGFNFIRLGTTALAAPINPEDDLDLAKSTLKQSLQFSVILGLFVLILSHYLSHFGLSLMLGSAPDVRLLPLTYDYSLIRFFAAPATFINFVLVGCAIAWQQPRIALVSLSTTALTNILLDILLIVIFDFKSQGAATASTVAEYTSVFVTLLVFQKHFPDLLKQTFFTFEPFSHYINLLKINADLFIRSVLLLLSFAFFQSLSTQLGATVTAANAILLQWIAFQSYTLDGFANATEALVGQHKNSPALKDILMKTFVFTLLTSATLVMLLSATHMLWMPLFTNLQAVLSAINEVKWFALLLPLISCAAYWLDGVAIGLAASRAMRNSILISSVFIFFPVSFGLLPMGNRGLWIAFVLFIFARSFTLGPMLYLSNRRNYVD